MKLWNSHRNSVCIVPINDFIAVAAAARADECSTYIYCGGDCTDANASKWHIRYQRTIRNLCSVWHFRDNKFSTIQCTVGPDRWAISRAWNVIVCEMNPFRMNAYNLFFSVLEFSDSLMWLRWMYFQRSESTAIKMKIFPFFGLLFY